MVVFRDLEPVSDVKPRQISGFASILVVDDTLVVFQDVAGRFQLGNAIDLVGGGQAQVRLRVEVS